MSLLKRFISSLISVGVLAEHSYSEQQRIRITNIVALISISVSPFYVAVAISGHSWAGAIISILAITKGITVIFLQSRQYYTAGKWLLLLGNGFSFVMLTLCYGRYLSMSYYLVALLSLIPVLFITKKQIFTAFVIMISLCLANAYVLENFIPLFRAATFQYVQYPNIILSSLILYFCLSLLHREDARYQHTIELQNSTLEQQKEEITAQRDNLSELNEEITQQKEELAAQRDDLEKQKNIVEKKNKTITDSINYAQRIQTGILPTEAEIRHFLPESFIYFRPKDIVSGDFYWFEAVTIENRSKPLIFLAVADCTGHGVPGAFMSMLGATILSQIVTDANIYEPAQILFELDNRIRKQLRQDEKGSDLRDGMDIGLCMIDLESHKLYFSAAQRPLLIIRKGEIIEVKGDKNPIGSGSYSAKIFTPHVVGIEEQDCVYLYSDGMTDQFNSRNNKRYGSKQFKQFLLSLSDSPLAYQREKLAEHFTAWQGLTTQTDDMITVGLRI